MNPEETVPEKVGSHSTPTIPLPVLSEGNVSANVETSAEETVTEVVGSAEHVADNINSTLVIPLPVLSIGMLPPGTRLETPADIAFMAAHGGREMFRPQPTFWYSIQVIDTSTGHVDPTSGTCAHCHRLGRLGRLCMPCCNAVGALTGVCFSCAQRGVIFTLCPDCPDDNHYEASIVMGSCPECGERGPPGGRCDECENFMYEPDLVSDDDGFGSD
jgi:hypothetical protein